MLFVTNWLRNSGTRKGNPDDIWIVRIWTVKFPGNIWTVEIWTVKAGLGLPLGLGFLLGLDLGLGLVLGFELVFRLRLGFSTERLAAPTFWLMSIVIKRLDGSFGMEVRLGPDHIV